jgi:hypothetical protein
MIRTGITDNTMKPLKGIYEGINFCAKPGAEEVTDLVDQYNVLR